MLRPGSLFLLGMIGLTSGTPWLAAAEPPVHFSTLITSKTAETFAAVQQFLKTAPATEREPAASWLFRTALDFGWESQVIAEADTYLQQANANPLTSLQAEQVRLLGLTDEKKAEESVQGFQLFIRKLRLRSPTLGSDLAEALAMKLQLAGDQAAALAVYEKLGSAFFLNAEIKDWTERRTTRLELLGRPMPEVSSPSFSGPPADFSAWKGKYVLLDFWATNCRPCLEDLPKLREIYDEFHPLGLEIAGISFDEEDVALGEFLERQKLPWSILKNDQRTAEQFHVELIPCLILIDPQGTVICTDVKVSHLRGGAGSFTEQNQMMLSAG